MATDSEQASFVKLVRTLWDDAAKAKARGYRTIRNIVALVCFIAGKLRCDGLFFGLCDPVTRLDSRGTRYAHD